MEPTKFAGSNMTFAENQPEYLPLPAHRSPEGTITTCWRMNWKERWQALRHGYMFLQQLTFGQPLQPQLPSMVNPLTGKVHTDFSNVVLLAHLENENDFLRGVLRSIKPPEFCPFCEEGDACHHCRSLATLQGEINGKLSRELVTPTRRSAAGRP